MDAGERKIYICVRRRTWFIKITIFYNCVLDIKDTSGFFNMLLLIYGVGPEKRQQIHGKK